ncbi:hypothetical protein GCM10011309_04450 [Litorimonas cladophorae]|uniref:Superoxide dismutase copper/zinc binding domain-containing protein n=1 Tax=Litorimonas cladophorae TaxID=1220491 RepID=A0A918NCI7_9PROT|nr:superoxide dismutase family protein [Litorimonas cladophorae]GGX58289.1 hypothetical protein GCM10011309_04450 [Litorimonas cladophorae]
MTNFALISALTTSCVFLVACGGTTEENSLAKDTPAYGENAVSFPIKNKQSDTIGSLELKPYAGLGVEIKVELSGLKPGTRAMHFHEFGRCDAPDFTTAGGHFNPAKVAHGNVDDGPHAGDMMNIEIDAEGNGVFVLFNEQVSIDGTALPALRDADGSALIIHEGADDYTSQPTGAAGGRAACAVIK